MDYVRIFHDHKSKFQSVFSHLSALSNCTMIYLYAGISGFLYSGTEDTSDIPCVGTSCSVHDRMSSSSPGLSPLDASSTPSPAVTNKNVSRHCHTSPGIRGQN